MKDFLKLRQECMTEVIEAGITPGTVSSWTVNTRARTRWGHCRKEKDGTFEIQIARQLLEDDRIPEKACKETIIHEILHTCYGCMNHKERWKGYAQRMNDRYGYNIKRVTTGNEKGVENYEAQNHLPVKYVFVCGGCGATIYRKRKSKFTRYYRNYICTRCGARAWIKKEASRC